MRKIHWFITQDDCEKFFSRLANNNGEELSPDFIFEGNSNMNYGWVVDLSKIVGYENLGVLQQDYDDEKRDFIDEFFIKPTRLFNPQPDISSVDIDADAVCMYPDGTIALWWD